MRFLREQAVNVEVEEELLRGDDILSPEDSRAQM
jgi:hypothetical protein